MRPDDDWPVVTVRGFISSFAAACLIVLVMWFVTIALIVMAP